MRLLRLLLAATCLSCAPELDPAAPTATQERGIIGGTPAPEDPAVVALVENVYGSWRHRCTGTLIGPRTVLTAAHCTSSTTLYVAFGASITSPTRVVKVHSQYPHPGYDPDALSNDIAVLRLDTSVPDVRPIAWNTQALGSAWEGQPLRQVGFGADSRYGSGSGTKRQATFAIRSVSSAHLQVGEGGTQICFGDSGGPGFITLPGQGEVVAGVASYTVGYCTETGYDARVDLYAASFIAPTIAPWETASCGADWLCAQNCPSADIDCACAMDGQCGATCTAPERDPDCPTDCAANGVCTDQCPIPDPDCKLDGETCSADQDCLMGRCVSDAQTPLPYCSRACSLETPCPSLMECRSGACAYKQRVPTEIGAACTDLSYCLFGSRCVGPSEEERRCAVPCGTSACAHDSPSCLVSFRGERYCAPEAQPVDAGTDAGPPVTPVGSAPSADAGTPGEESAGPGGACAAVPGSTALAVLGSALLLRGRRRSR